MNCQSKRFNYKGEDIKRLDVSQLEAVNASSGSLKVVASAGSGKTKVLINRVIKLLNEGVNPDGVLYFWHSSAVRKTQCLSDYLH